MAFVIAYFGLFLVTLLEARHALEEGAVQKLRLLLVVAACHLWLALAYLAKMPWLAAAIGS